MAQVAPLRKSPYTRARLRTDIHLTWQRSRKGDHGANHRSRQQLDMEQVVVKDLFNHAARSSQSHSSDRKLSFRQDERHMPKEFSVKSGRCAEFVFRMEGYTSILDPSGK